jgi:hypothetical protein
MTNWLFLVRATNQMLPLNMDFHSACMMAVKSYGRAGAVLTV